MKFVTTLASCAFALSLAAGAASAADAVKAKPGASEVLFENAYIRVIRSHFAPGAAEGAHTHPAGWYYVVKGGALDVKGADGKTTVWAAKAGDTEWSNGEGLHSAVNRGRAPMEYLLVEVKAAPTATPN